MHNKQNNKQKTKVGNTIINVGLALLLTTPPIAWAEQASTPTQLPSTTLAQTTFGLLFVLGLLMLLAWLLKRTGLTKQQKRGGFYKVLATSSLGPREKIVLVEIGDTWLVLGMTANNINTLHSMPAGSIDLEPTQNPAVTFAKLLERVKKNPKVKP